MMKFPNRSKKHQHHKNNPFSKNHKKEPQTFSSGTTFALLWSNLFHSGTWPWHCCFWCCCGYLLSLSSSFSCSNLYIYGAQTFHRCSTEADGDVFLLACTFTVVPTETKVFLYRAPNLYVLWNISERPLICSEAGGSTDLHTEISSPSEGRNQITVWKILEIWNCSGLGRTSSSGLSSSVQLKDGGDGVYRLQPEPTTGNLLMLNPCLHQNMELNSLSTNKSGGDPHWVHSVVHVEDEVIKLDLEWC